MSEPITNEDFQALVAELKKTNKQLSQQARGGFAGGIKKTIDDVKDSVTSPFRKIKETLAAPGKFIGDTIEDIGDAVMTPFKSFKNVSEGFKNIFSKNETKRQTELLEQILQSIEDLNQNVSVDTNREQNQDLLKLEQGKEQKGIFKSISDNIKNAATGGRGSRRKGKGGASGGGDRGFFANMVQDFFLAAIVTQRGIGQFARDGVKNVVDTFKAVSKPFKMIFGGVKKLGKGAINLARDVFGKDKGQKGIPFRRAVVKEKVAGAVSSVTDKVQGLKDKFFPKIPEQIEAQPGPGGFDTNNLFSGDIVESNNAIVEAVKENTSSLVKVLTGNDLKKAETEKERDKTFQDIADSLEDIEGSDLGKGAENKKGEGLISEIINEYGGTILAALGGKKLLGSKLGKNLVNKGKGLFSRLNPFSGKKASTSVPSLKQPTLTGPAQTISNAGQAGANASSNTIKNITNAPGSSVVDAPKPKGGFFSRLNPMNKIKDATKGIAKQFPSVLKRVPVIGGVVEGIFLNSAIKTILEDPEASENEKKDAVGTEFIKALTGPAGAAIAIGAVTAATGGVGFLASALTGTAGYAIGNVVGSVLASVLPTKTIGGAIINTFYKKESAQGQAKPQTKTQNPVKTVTQEVKEKRFDASRVAAKEAEAALAKFESENQGAEMIELPRDMFDDPEDGPTLEYKDPEKQAQFEKLRSNTYDTERKQSQSARNVMGLKDRFTGSNSGRDTLKTVDFIQDKFGIQFPGASKNAQGLTQYKGSGAAIQFAQDLFAKNPNATGAEMLQAIQRGNDVSAELFSSMDRAAGSAGGAGVSTQINAPTNSNITTINEAPNHIDRTVGMFGAQPAY